MKRNDVSPNVRHIVSGVLCALVLLVAAGVFLAVLRYRPQADVADVGGGLIAGVIIAFAVILGDWL